MRWRKHAYNGRAAWLLENERLRFVMLEGGGHVAEIALAGSRPPGGINPFWQPPWPAIEPYRFSMERDGARYGGGREARLLSGICGHNVCFDYWGPPSADEQRRGLSFHGEAGVVRWKAKPARASKTALELTCLAEMPLSAARLTRTVRLRPGETAVYFEETAENLTALDRAIGWVQHVSLARHSSSAAPPSWTCRPRAAVRCRAAPAACPATSNSIGLFSGARTAGRWT